MSSDDDSDSDDAIKRFVLLHDRRFKFVGGDLADRKARNVLEEFGRGVEEGALWPTWFKYFVIGTPLEVEWYKQAGAREEALGTETAVHDDDDDDDEETESSASGATFDMGDIASIVTKMRSSLHLGRSPTGVCLPGALHAATIVGEFGRIDGHVLITEVVGEDDDKCLPLDDDDSSSADESE